MRLPKVCSIEHAPSTGATMNNTLAPRLVAAFSAAFLTLAMLAGVNGLAVGEHVDARLAQAAAAHKG